MRRVRPAVVAAGVALLTLCAEVREAVALAQLFALYALVLGPRVPQFFPPAIAAVSELAAPARSAEPDAHPSAECDACRPAAKPDAEATPTARGTANRGPKTKKVTAFVQAFVGRSGVVRPQLLRAERVQQLQRRIIDGALRRHFAIRARRRELSVLARFSSVRWVCRNLLIGAGYGPGGSATAGASSTHRRVNHAPATRAELRHRCAVVFPIVVATLHLHAKHLESHGGSLPPKQATDAVTGCLYPEVVHTQREKSVGYAAVMQSRSRGQSRRLAAHQLRLVWYLHAVTALQRHSRARHSRALTQLERIALLTTRSNGI